MGRATIWPMGDPIENILAQDAKITANNTKTRVDVFIILFCKQLPSLWLRRPVGCNEFN